MAERSALDLGVRLAGVRHDRVSASLSIKLPANRLAKAPRTRRTWFFTQAMQRNEKRAVFKSIEALE
ncbi:hypothetical protein [Xanthomonas euvesicatoria]|uniref:hypothetical protein n=1 Tax=Xanthomonas euvesicatoria TaxID=456327 RepID=UPI00245692F5|nr:hypothetical protein [Xanthomonas euvesicatoria]MDH4909171.1 hypothetical protein [Xanthomonas euvesicatoria]